MACNYPKTLIQEDIRVYKGGQSVLSVNYLYMSFIHLVYKGVMACNYPKTLIQEDIRVYKGGQSVLSVNYLYMSFIHLAHKGVMACECDAPTRGHSRA